MAFNVTGAGGRITGLVVLVAIGYMIYKKSKNEKVKVSLKNLIKRDKDG